MSGSASSLATGGGGVSRAGRPAEVSAAAGVLAEPGSTSSGWDPFVSGVLAMLVLAVLLLVAGNGLSVPGRVAVVGVGGAVLAGWRTWRSRDRRRREAELEGRRVLLARAFVASADPMSLADSGGRVVWVNPAFTDLTGYADEDLSALTLASMESGEGVADAAGWAGRWGTVMSGEVWQGETEYRRRDGTRYVAALTLTPVRDAAGVVTHVLGMHRDGTVRRAMELELRRLNGEHARELEEERLNLAGVTRDLEMFAYAVSHDLRAPLRAIDFFGREMLDQVGGQLDEGSRGCLERVFTARRRMSMIIDAMMGLFHLGRGELRWIEVDVSELAADAVEELRRAHPGREVEVEIQPGLRVRADQRLLQAALAALLDNAWKFTGKKAEARIEVGAMDREEGRVFFVRDNGVGFDMAYADRLFTAIRRLHTQEEFEGCGIGLVSVQRALQRHHGRVWVEAAEGSGATFYFVLGPGPRPGGPSRMDALRQGAGPAGFTPAGGVMADGTSVGGTR